MFGYRSPLHEMQFVYSELFSGAIQSSTSGEPENLEKLFGRAATWAQGSLAPHSAGADVQGCEFNEGYVYTPDTYPESYAQYCRDGWSALTGKSAYGGRDYPVSVGLMVSEICGTADWAWSLYASTSVLVMRLIEYNGSEQQKQQLLPSLYSGIWTGTVCLSEAHCGSDLGLLRTQAIGQSDGSYLISGTKIFVSSGEHDLSDNILYLVLARTSDSDPAEKGLSLFLVPKYQLDTTGAIPILNQVACEAIEEKMGLHGNATCVMNFDQATGVLIGELGGGMACLSRVQYEARLRAGMQGVALAEKSFQGAQIYARERMHMRSLSGAKAPGKKTAPIIDHPDIKRMLLTQKSFAEGGRCLLYDAAHLLDLHHENRIETAEQRALLMFLSLLAKGFLAEVGLEATSIGLQVLGGHGYLREWGMEQHVRDCRMAPLYEGTTGVQALNLLKFCVLDDTCRGLEPMLKRIDQFSVEYVEHESLSYFVEELHRRRLQWQQVVEALRRKVQKNPQEIGAASHDFLCFSGYTVLAYYWALNAALALKQHAAGDERGEFFQQKYDTARFYFTRIFPRTEMHLISLGAGTETLSGLKTG